MPIIHSAEAGSEWAAELGTAIHDIIEELTSHYRVKESGGSTLFILNNDTDETLHRSFKQEDSNGQWVKDVELQNGELQNGELQNGEPPPIIPKRSKGIFMLSYSRNSFGAEGSIVYRIGQRDSTRKMVIRYKNDPNGQLVNNKTFYEVVSEDDSGSNKVYEASCYRNAHPGGEKPDDDVDIGLTYVRDGEKMVPGAFLKGSPCPLVVDDIIYCFHQGRGDNELWWNMHGNKELGDRKSNSPSGFLVQLSGSPSAVMYDGRLRVFHREPDRAATLALWQGSLLKQSLFFVEQNHELTWTDTFTYEGPGPRVEMSGSPSAVVWKNDLWVFHQGGTNNKALFAFVYNHEKGSWNEDMHIPDVELSESPCAVVANDRLHVIYQGPGHSGELWHIVSSDGKNWSKARVPKTGMSSSPSVVFANGKLYVFHQGWGNNVRIWCNIKNEADSDDKWFGDRPCFTANTNEAPGVVAYRNQLWCFHQGIYNLGELWHKEFPI